MHGGIGHNSLDGQALQVFIDRIERLEEEKSALGDDIKAVYDEAKAEGFDVKTIRAVVRLCKQESEKRQLEAEMLNTYLHALGMI